MIISDGRDNMSIRSRVFDIIQPDDGTSLLSRIFDWMITGLILASVIIVFVATFDLPQSVRELLLFIEGMASIVFTVEYVLRILTADFLYPERGKIKARIKYVLSPMAIVDLIAILPFWLPMFLPGTMLGLRALRLVRLLRIFKLNRYFDAIKSLGDVIVRKKRELLGSMFFVSILMLISSLLMYSAEHEAQPEVFRNAVSGLWWAVATLTTVGYGDIYPVSTLGRIITMVSSIFGIAIVALPAGIITAGYMNEISKSDETDDEVKEDEKDGPAI